MGIACKNLNEIYMITIILSEFKSWYLKFSKYSLSIFITILSIVSVISLLKPIFCTQVITVLLIWLGWLSGKQSWSEIKYSDWVEQTKIPVKRLLIGKILSIILIVSLHLFFIFPIFILMIIMRGISIQLFLLIMISMILSTLISLCLTFLFNWIEIYDFEYFGTLFLILWLLTTLFAPSLNFINPIMQVKNIFEAENSMFILFSITINLLLILLFSSFTGFFLYLKKRG